MATYERLDYGSDDGCQIGGAATDKIAFYGATPIVRRSGAAQAALTGTTVSATAGRGFKTSAAFNAMIAQLEEIRATLVALGMIKGGA